MSDVGYLHLLSVFHNQSQKKVILIVFENKFYFWIDWFSGHRFFRFSGSRFFRLPVLFFQQIKGIILLFPDFHCCFEKSVINLTLLLWKWFLISLPLLKIFSLTLVLYFYYNVFKWEILKKQLFAGGSLNSWMSFIVSENFSFIVFTHCLCPFLFSFRNFC